MKNFINKIMHNCSLFFIIFLVAHNANSQSCSIDVKNDPNIYWSTESWSCSGGPSAPTTNGMDYTGDINIIDLSGNLRVNLSLTIHGDITIGATGASPTITIPAGDTLIVYGNILNPNNNVRYVIDGFVQIFGKIEGKNNNLFSGSGTITGDSLVLDNNAGCGDGGCPTISFTTCISGNSFCADNNDAPVLPVDFKDFHAYNINGDIIIKWSTYYEFATAHFEIQRSLDGNIFETIGSVSSENSSSGAVYEFKDNRLTKDHAYYRVRQVDLDGSASYTSVIALKHIISNHPFGELSFYPNPMREGEQLFLNVDTGEEEEEVLVVVYDIIGNVCYTEVIHTNHNHFYSTLNMQNKLQPGIYLIEASSHNHVVASKKLIIR